jgi:hypothetical protein
VIASQLRGHRSGLIRREVFLDSILSMPEVIQYDFSREDVRGMEFEEQLAYQWMVQNDKVLKEMDRQSDYRVVRYEDTCRHPAQTMEDLFSFSGLTMEKETRDFIVQLDGLDGQDRGYFSVMRSPLNSLDRWRTDLSADQISRIMKVVSGSRVGALYEGDNI